VNFHNSLFQRKSLNSVYVNCLVDNLQTFLPAFRDVFSGFSVTMPFKEQIVLALDKIDPAVSELGVANTVINNHDRLEGYNTDLLAIEQLLKERADLRGKKAIVLGTGGTSRAMAYAAQRRGAAVTVVGRTLDKVQRLAVEFGCNFALAENLSELSCDLLMNGTPLGMKPESDPLPVPSEFLKSGMIVFDAVYTPEVTPLLRMATFNGCKIIKGTELFHQQGMFQHDLFMRVA
jgi:shikimate dehydrogenase